MNQGRGLRLGLGPVFAAEQLALARRWQWYALRSLFAGLLLLALLVGLFQRRVDWGAMTLRDLATLGQTFYIAVIGTQITLVLLAAPAATAGSICHDRASGTLTHLLVTDLSDREIVLGKLAARLVPVLGLVACLVPILAILTLLGGVDPLALLGSVLVTVGIALLGCSLALVFSLWARRTHEALMATYSVWGLWLVGRPLLDLFNRGLGLGIALPPSIADPYSLAFSSYWQPNSASLANSVWFLAATALIATALVGLAIARLRPACIREDRPRPRALAGSRRGRLDRLAAILDITRHLPGPSLDRNPVLWREWHQARPSRWGRIIASLFAVLATLASLAAVLAPPAMFAPAWVNGLQVSIGLLLLSVTASTSLAEERVRGSLDVLMATPLSTREIVLGKWLGAFRPVPALAVLPVLLLVLSRPSRPEAFLSAGLMLGFMVACGGAIVGLGLALATWCNRLSRAVALTVSGYLVVTVGWLFACGGLSNGPAWQGLDMASPFMFAGWLAADLCGPGTRQSHLGWATVWLIVDALAALGLLGVTLLTFNRCLGRIEGPITPPTAPQQGPMRPAPARVPDAPRPIAAAAAIAPP